MCNRHVLVTLEELSLLFIPLIMAIGKWPLIYRPFVSCHFLLFPWRF